MHARGARLLAGPSADVSIWLWGSINESINADANNVLWVIGHPQTLLTVLSSQRADFATAFKHIFCSSQSFASKLSEHFKLSAEWLACPAPLREQVYTAEPKYELTFIGNADPAKGRPELASILLARRSAVYGEGWSLSLGDTHKSAFLPWADVPVALANAKLIIASEHVDMREHGIVSDAALDWCLNGSALCLPRANKGYAELGIDTPQWSDMSELASLVKAYLGDEDARVKAKEAQRAAASEFTYDHVAGRMLECS